MSRPRRIPRRLPCRAARLAGAVGWSAARHGSAEIMNVFRDGGGAEQIRAERHRETAARVAGALGTLRGGAAKLGQLASLVELDFIPEPYRDVYRTELAALRDAAPAMDWPLVRRVLEQEWRAPPELLLADIDPDPAAAASIGQVHRATLADGRRVAVKVQYPGIADAFGAEARSAARLLPLARGLAPGLDTTALAAELRTRLVEELDYRLEGGWQAAFARAYDGHPFIHVPRVHASLTRRRVLVTDWVDGARFDDVRRLPQPERDRFGEILFRFYLGAIGVLGRFNADAHPGNYLLRADGSVAFLDFGSVKVPAPAFLRATTAMLRAGIAADADGVHAAMTRLGFLRQPDLAEPRRALAWLEASSGWLLEDRALTIDAAVVRPQLPFVTGGSFELARALPGLDLPPDELLFGRLRTSLLAVLGQLRATANWSALGREWWLADPPRTALGRAEWEFLAGRRLSYAPGLAA